MRSRPLSRKSSKKTRRDLELPPPSSRRGPLSPRAYQYAVTASLVRSGMTDGRAARLVQKWGRLVELRRVAGKASASTAAHVERFERQHILMPYPLRERDPAFSKKDLWKGIEKDQRKASREKIAGLKAKVSKALSLRKESRASAKSYCERERAKARERANAIRERMKAEAKSLAEAERNAARWQCKAERRAHGLEIARLRGELEAEKKFQADMRRIAATNKARSKRPGLAKARERRDESDDEVRANIPPDLAPLFERVKRGIKGSPRKSRTEAFLEYVEEHPDEQFAGIDDKTDALVRELERQQRSGRRDARRRRLRRA